MIELPVTLTSTGGAVSFASPVTLGYTKNKGVYRLLVTAEGEWEGLTIRCFWHLPGGTDPASSLVQNGAVDVPASVTAHPGNGCITFEGSDGEKTVTSADLRYKVGSNSGTEDGTIPEPGTPAWEQLVSETKTNADAAEQAKNDAQAAAEGVKTAAAKAEEAAERATQAGIAASNAADDAAGSAVAAGNAASAAAGSESAAAKSAQAALESKTAAATSEGNAAASAKKANDIADSLPADYTTAVNDIAALKTNKADKADLGTVQKQIGNLDDLTTKAKETLVAAINEAARTGAAMRTDGGYIQYSTDDGSTWENLIALAELKGEPGQNGADGAPGADGYSPTASVDQSTDGAKITITDKSGTTEAVVKNGKDGANGRDGADGQPGRDGVNGQPGKDGTDGITPTIGDNGNWFLGATDTGKPSRGATGDTGTDGKDAPQIDDTAITTTNPWSSKHIIDMLCPPLEESGNPVVCYPVAGYSLGVKASWEPVQEGSGTPSPENIRPIKGRDSVTVERCGENLLHIKPFNKDQSKGITYEYVPDGGIHISGTALASVDSPIFLVWHLPPGKYYGINMGAGIAASIVVRRNGANLWLNAKGVFEILAGDVIKYWYMVVNNGSLLDTTIYPYIVPGTTAPTTYTPYIGQTNTLTLPETVYGGEVDAVSGEGQETWETVTLDGTENWKKVTNVQNPYFRASILHLGAVTLGSLAAKCTAFPLVEINGNNSNNGFNGWDASLYIRWASLSTVDVLKSYLASQYAAGTPVQICYKPKKPVPFTATGAQPMPALAGVNTVLTDADSATVTGRADPIKRIADLENKE